MPTGTCLFFETDVVPGPAGLWSLATGRAWNRRQNNGDGPPETDWRRLLEREDIDLIDIVTPNHLHAEMAIAAAEAGKHIVCEKPLAMSVDQAERMVEAVEKSREPSICFATTIVSLQRCNSPKS